MVPEHTHWLVAAVDPGDSVVGWVWGDDFVLLWGPYEDQNLAGRTLFAKASAECLARLRVNAGYR